MLSGSESTESPEEMVRYIENTIALLDRVFGGEILDNDRYYNTLIRNWWTEKEKSFGVAKPKRKAYERAITDYSTIRPKYSYNGKQVVLTIPSIRLKNNFCAFWLVYLLVVYMYGCCNGLLYSCVMLFDW